MLSNADPPMLAGAIQANDLTGLFSAILSADQLQTYKPRPQVYQMATDHFQCEPQQLVFISSNTWDVAGAKQFGLKVVWLNRTGGTMEVLGPKADHEISNLEALAGLHFNSK